jgi:alkylation response protein AidB-like acyl-CoA dehydrogenase
LAQIVGNEFQIAGAPHPMMGTAADSMLRQFGNALLAHGTDEQKADLLPRLLRDEIGRGCLLYSEPGAGSDLAGLQTRADREGDEFVVNGQKVWTSGAHLADFGLLLARTRWDVPKHEGISYFYFPMRQPGVEVRPLRQATGIYHFNEVFITDARVSAANLIGGLNAGWRVLQTALAYERSGMGSGRRHAPPQGDLAKSPVLEGAADLANLARASNCADDPLIRQRIAQVHTWRLVNRWNSERSAAELTGGGSSSSLASLGKLSMSRILHATGTLGRLMLGPRSLLFDYDDPDRYPQTRMAMHAFATSISGGTDQIQRNVIAERILGLPRGPEPDRGRPFSEVSKAEATRRLGS